MTSLSIILKSKIGKEKRAIRIKQLEKELGIGQHEDECPENIVVIEHVKSKLEDKKIIDSYKQLDPYYIHGGKNFLINERVRTTSEHDYWMRHLEGTIIDCWFHDSFDPECRRGYTIKCNNLNVEYIDGYWLERA